MSAAPSHAAETSRSASRTLPFLGLCCLVGVSTVYLCQPLLPSMGASFGKSAAAAGMVGVSTQTGYALGLLLCVPLGDIVERRSLMTRLYAAVGVALLLVALAPTLPLLIAASAVAGSLACVTHIALPIAPDMAAPKERGRAIGIVMTGLLLGVLLARTFSGWINDAAEHLLPHIAGWRVVFAVAGAVSLLFSLAMPRVMPLLPARGGLRYGDAMRSLWTVFRGEPLLRESSLMGALCFGSFSIFWNTLGFLLARHGLGAGVAGSFGLVGAGGAAAATFMGRLSDRRGPRLLMSVSLALLGGSYLLVYFAELFAAHGERHGGLPTLPYLVGLAFAVVVMDIGMQSAQIANQTRIFALRPDARARINTVYMVSYFTGAAISTALSTVVWQRHGAIGVTLLEGAIVLIAVVVHLRGDRQPYRRPSTLQDVDPRMLEV